MNQIHRLIANASPLSEGEPITIYSGSVKPTYVVEKLGWDCGDAFVIDGARVFHVASVEVPPSAPEVSRMRFKLLWGALERIEIYKRAEIEPAFADFIRLLDDPLAITVEMGNQSVAYGIGFIVNSLAAIPNDQKAHRYGQILSNTDPS